ncbi:MAG: cupredoxin domain-containing protein [Deltaproteobacteria bacterium]|nr:cupredoxin domain-containing protein [Deltaproteobacteria bacterium]
MKMKLIATAALALFSTMAHAETRKFAMNTVEVSGVKMWLPSTMVVKKGDEVEITATSRLGKGTMHGFTIEGYKIVEAPDEKGKVIKFTADKAGIFPFRCHLHPAHVGGQLVVLE